MLPAEEAQDLVNLKEKKLDPQTSFVAQQMIGRSRPLLLPTGRFGRYLYFQNNHSRVLSFT